MFHHSLTQSSNYTINYIINTQVYQLTPATTRSLINRADSKSSKRKVLNQAWFDFSLGSPDWFLSQISAWFNHDGYSTVWFNQVTPPPWVKILNPRSPLFIVLWTKLCHLLFLTPICKLWTKNPQIGYIVERHMWTKNPHEIQRFVLGMPIRKLNKSQYWEIFEFLNVY